MAKSLLTVSNLQIKIDRNIILKDISFTVLKNQSLAIIGPNGAGKTTLFRALLGLIPYQGKIAWQPGIKIGYVPQRISVDRDLPITTEDFFSLKKSSQKEMKQALLAVGVNHLLKEKLGVLSGGELQRILIAWALVGNPDVLLFDEPTAGIDVSAEETIYSLLYRLQKQKNLTILLISHELQVVYKYATNVLCLNKEEVCFGPPKQVLDKESLAKIFGSNVGLYQHH